jgi:saccharopine dehydrogenase-like NADP-dependent oxidoreductase
VVEAAIDAGVHYIDIADGRAFVAGITAFDAAAKAANVAVICGASSTPALSDTAASHITKGWHCIDSLRVVISPSNRQPRGVAVIAAILTYVGQPLRIFTQGKWQTAYGWGDTRRVTLPRVGRRWASLCDTPDLDQLVLRHAPRVEASFYASLELSIMHLGLMALGWLVRVGLLKSLHPFARVLNWLAGWLEPFGNDWGGMTVEAKGHGLDGKAQHSLWWLAAKGNIGPHVPILAALASARALRDGVLTWRGAAPCVGFLDLAAFDGDFAALGIQTGIELVSDSG